MSAPRRASRKAEARCVRYAPLRDPEFRNVFGNPKRGGFVRRELEGYGAKKVTEVGDDLRGGSCCYLRKGETEYPYDERGKRGGVRYATTPIKDCARGAGLESCESQGEEYLHCEAGAAPTCTSTGTYIPTRKLKK